MQAICWLVAAQNDSTSVVTRDVARNKIRVGIQCDLFSFVPCRIAPPRLLHACFTPATRLKVNCVRWCIGFPGKPDRTPGGALGYFLGGYVPPGTPNWYPVLEKISPKIDTPF